MANKIKITTTELREQAGRMDALNDRLDGVIAQMNSALKKIDDSTCAKFSSNIIVKTASLRRNMQNARNNLLIGVGIARLCAESYTNADIVIRKNIADINTPEVQNTAPSEQKVSSNIEEIIETLGMEAYDDRTNNWGGKKYKNEVGRNDSSGWCDAFVCWLLKKAGIDISNALAGQISSMKKNDCYMSAKNYTPKTGDLIFFDWEGDGLVNHVGMIYIADDGTVYVIHGNYHMKLTGNRGEVSYDKLDDGYLNKYVCAYGDMTTYTNR